MKKNMQSPITHCYWIMQEKCDISCKGCFYTILKRTSSQNNELGVAQKLIDYGFQTVALTGGDPLFSKVRNTTFEVIELLKKAGIKVILNSALVSLTQEDLDKLKSLGVDRIDTSIDSCEEEIHNKLRGKYRDVLEASRYLISKDIHLTGTITVRKENIETVEKTYKMMLDMGFKSVEIHGIFHPEMAAVEKQEIANIISKVVPEDKNIKYYLQKPPYGTTCSMGRKSIVIDPKGNVKRCFANQNILTNIFDKDFLKSVQKLQQTSYAEKSFPSCFTSQCYMMMDSTNTFNQ